jgi:hypothetical protein
MLLVFITALSVAALRLALHAAGRPADGTDFMLVHFLAMITTVFFGGMRLLRSDPQASFPSLLRDGFRHAALYAVLMLLFLWFYYTQVETDVFARKIEERVAMAISEGQPGDLVRTRMEQFFTPFNYATITFFALLAVGALQSFLIALLHHKVLRRTVR